MLTLNEKAMLYFFLLLVSVDTYSIDLLIEKVLGRSCEMDLMSSLHLHPWPGLFRSDLRDSDSEGPQAPSPASEPFYPAIRVH